MEKEKGERERREEIEKRITSVRTSNIKTQPTTTETYLVQTRPT